jgi:hypothetical protein
VIEEFDQDLLHRRRSFLETRAKAHLTIETDRQWHHAAAATLLRDAAAVAFIIGDNAGGRSLLQSSGDLFFRMGFAGGLQLLYIAHALDANDAGTLDRIENFHRAFNKHIENGHRDAESQDAKFQFSDDSFHPAQLLRAYQALTGWISEDDKWLTLRREMYDMLSVNATMPVGTARTPLAIYLQTYEQLARQEVQAAKEPSGMLKQVLNSLVQRREELLVAARRDRFHWKALLRPAELVDFDLLSLVLVGVRRGHTRLITRAFSKRDAIIALPLTLAKALRK